MSDPAIFALIACLGVFVFSFAGFAGALTAVPLMAIFLDPKDFVPALAIAVHIQNIPMSWEARRHVDFVSIRWIIGGCFFGIPFGVLVLSSLSGDWMGFGIGLFSLSMGLLFLAKVKVPMNDAVSTQLLVGLLSGLLGGATTAGGPPVVFYALARGWKRDQFRSTLMVYFLCLALFSISLFLARGMITSTVLIYAGVALLPMFVATRIGVWLKQRTNETGFRTAILVIITVTGGVGVLKSGWELFGKDAAPFANNTYESAPPVSTDRSAIPVLRKALPSHSGGEGGPQSPPSSNRAPVAE